MRSALVLVLLAATALASPPVTPAGKPAKDAKVVEPRKPDPKPAARKAESVKLEAHAETKKADAAPSTLSLKKKPSHRVYLADWAP